MVTVVHSGLLLSQTHFKPAHKDSLESEDTGVEAETFTYMLSGMGVLAIECVTEMHLRFISVSFHKDTDHSLEQH